jgi:hypothetical protein
MGALSIAFDTVIAGALALPWVVLVVYLFLPDGAGQVRKLRDWAKPIGQSAAFGVLLFAVAYTLGSAVSRIAQDFFNDDDLNFPVDRHQFRVGATEDRIRTSVYCGELYDEQLLSAEPGNAYLKSKIKDFRAYGNPLCWQVLRWSASFDELKDKQDERWKEEHKEAQEDGQNRDDDLIAAAYDIFSYQESALMLQGEDSTLRLRQLHDQIMVLRGAAFNGVVAFSLCCFAWGASLRREKPASRAFRVLLSLPVVYLLMFAIAVINHLSERAISDPPYMEFILFLIGGAGAWLLWEHPGRYLVTAGFLLAALGALHHHECLLAHRPCLAPIQFRVAEAVLLATSAIGAWLLWKYKPKSPATSEDQVHASQPAASKKKHPYGNEKWAGLVLLSCLLTSAVSLGWWSSEVLYAEQLIYSYKALNDAPPHSATVSGKQNR